MRRKLARPRASAPLHAIEGTGQAPSEQTLAPAAGQRARRGRQAIAGKVWLSGAWGEAPAIAGPVMVR
jgi:hypothetical protein